MLDVGFLEMKRICLEREGRQIEERQIEGRQEFEANN